MQLASACRAILAASAVTVANLAAASGPDTGPGIATSDVSPKVFFGLLGGVVALGVVIWLGLKLMNRKA